MAFKPSAGKKHKRADDGELNMNSMMDMVTIILLFLLKSYSTDGALETSADDLKLPESISLTKPDLIPMLEVSHTLILFDRQEVLNFVDNTAPNYKSLGDKFVIEPLKQVLKVASDDAKKVEEYGGVFDHKILLRIDKTTPFEVLVKVMKTCSVAGFYEIRLMVEGGANDV